MRWLSNRTLKCFWCGIKDKEDKIEVVNGTQKKRYHKLNCYDLYIKDQEFKKKEKEELDELVEVIKKVHGIETIPSQFYSYLQDIRNGNELFGRIGNKKSKQGYPYKTITATYEECLDSINWARNNRDFKGTMALLKYTRAIILDKIDGVSYKIESRKRKEEVEKATEEQAVNVFEHINRQPTEYKRRKSIKDASSFLD